MKKTQILILMFFGYFNTSVSAETFQLTLEVPKINATEYHAPYIATWIESSDRNTVIPSSLWYDDQQKWLKDIRQWWRRTGRTQSKPYDGVTGATRRPGMHKLVLNSQEIAPKLKPGSYLMMIEAAREVGGREVLSIEFQWPITAEFERFAQGEKELGKVTLNIKP